MVLSDIRSSPLTEHSTRWSVRAQQSWEYDLVWSDDLLANPTALHDSLTPFARPIFVVDSAVHGLYEEALAGLFAAVHPQHHVVLIDGGEDQKDLDAVSYLVDQLDAVGVQRRTDVLVAIGGGVVSDLVTFTASTYRRGVRAFRVPTTLLGLVDAAVGVKTGVNHRGQKNRIGTYFASEVSLLTPCFLNTLPRRQVRNGVGEILKVALACDAALFDLVEGGCLRRSCSDFIDHDDRDDVCQAAVAAMSQQLERNLWERDLRRAVDLGHTFSGKVELSRRDLLHGEAVAWETLLAAQFSHNRGWLSGAEMSRIVRLFADAGLLFEVSLSRDEWEGSLAEIELHRDGWQHIPVPATIGEVEFVEDSTVSEWARAAADVVAASVEIRSWMHP